MSNDYSDTIDGLIDLIDAIQDYACDTLGVPEDEIYLFEDNEPEE